jgi:hypothetical protein
MTVLYVKPKSLDNIRQAMAPKLAVEIAAKFNRTQGFGVIAYASPLELIFKKAVVKTRIMGYQSATF